MCPTALHQALRMVMVLHILVLVIGFECRKHPKDPPPPELFTLTRKTHKYSHHYPVKWLNGTEAYRVRTWRRHFLFQSKLHVTPVRGTELGTEVSTNVEGGWIWCHQKQTYVTTQGLEFWLDTRGGYADFWYIRPNANLNVNDTFVFHRRPSSRSGPVRFLNGTYVAHMHEHALETDGKGIVYKAKYTISSNGVIPNDILIQFFNTILLRGDDCIL